MTRAEIGSGVASARAALVGNPSDGYGGAVLAVTLDERAARARAHPAEKLDVEPDSALVRAAVERLARELAPEAASTAVRWSTTIPRGVGLGGSSAIVIATLRAVCSLYGLTLTPAALAGLALAVEVEDLGIAAGLQDRVAQCYGGLTFMDFAPGVGAAGYERLDPGLLPPLLVAWRHDAAQESAAVHAPLRARFERGEPGVLSALGELGELGDLARAARAALARGEQTAFARCVDASFAARRRMLTLDPRHVEMIDCARDGGASANFAGSGGAIVAVCEERHLDRVQRGLQAIGCRTLVPARPGSARGFRPVDRAT